MVIGEWQVAVSFVTRHSQFATPKQIRSRDAWASELCQGSSRSTSPGREAERRKAHPTMAAPRNQMLPPECVPRPKRILALSGERDALAVHLSAADPGLGNGDAHERIGIYRIGILLGSSDRQICPPVAYRVGRPCRSVPPRRGSPRAAPRSTKQPARRRRPCRQWIYGLRPAPLERATFAAHLCGS